MAKLLYNLVPRVSLLPVRDGKKRDPGNEVGSSTLSYQHITPHNSSIRSDEGLMLETSAFQTFRGGNSIFINSFAKTIFFFHAPTDAAPWIDFPNPLSYQIRDKSSLFGRIK